MTSDARQPDGYTRHTIAIADADTSQAIAAFGALPDAIVVNIVGEGGAVAFSEEQLRAELERCPAQLTVETLPLAIHAAVMRGKIERILQDVEALRAMLRTQRIGDVAAGASALIHQLDQLRFLVRGYVLQRVGAELLRAVQSIDNLRAQFERSAFDAADNVRCMDDLHYGIAPALRQLLRSFAAK